MGFLHFSSHLQGIFVSGEISRSIGRQKMEIYMYEQAHAHAVDPLLLAEG